MALASRKRVKGDASLVTVSKKGWVVIPKEIRERHGIRPGDRVHVLDVAGRISIVKAREDPIAQGRGLLKGGPLLTEELIREHREEVEREERKIRQWLERR